MKIKKFNENLNGIEILLSTNLREYSKYLLDEYIIINPNWEDSSMYYHLNQFYEEGKIKDLIPINSKIETKVQIINIIRENIIKFSEQNKKNVDIDTFEDFQLKLSSPEEYLMKKRSRKYNL